MGRLLKYFFVGFLAGFLLFFAVLVLTGVPVDEATVMSAVAGFVYALFCVGFMTRLMKTAVLEINTSNRDPQKGMQWYAEEIRQHIYDLRFRKVVSRGDVEVYHPTGFRKVWERKVDLFADSYAVKVIASRFVIRSLSDLVEIKPAQE